MNKHLASMIMALGLTATLSSTPTHAAAPKYAPRTEYNNGAGIVLGEPSGFTAKLWQDKEHAIDLGLAFSFSSFMLIYGDYLWHFHSMMSNSSQFSSELNPYAGLGAAVFFSTDSSRTDKKYFTDNGNSVGIGFRIPLGMEWRPVRSQLGVFLEVVPGVGFIPSSFGFITGGIGARYYFF